MRSTLDSLVYTLPRIVTLQIKTMMNNIFEQVKRSNSLEDYEAFLAKYPNSPGYSNEARRRIARIKPQKSP